MRTVLHSRAANVQLKEGFSPWGSMKRSKAMLKTFSYQSVSVPSSFRFTGR
jgi:hypothetical protein